MQAFQSSAAAVYGRLYVLPSNNQTSPLISGDRRTAYSLSCDSPVPVFIDLPKDLQTQVLIGELITKRRSI